MSSHADTLLSAAEILSNGANSRAVLLGFDGFIDEIVHAVNVRTGVDTFERLDTMASFGDRIRDAAGLSCNIEIVSLMTKLGGNGPIMANAMARYRHKVTYAGALGKDSVAPVFKDLAAACNRVILLAEPAQTTALEFLDGKVMLGKTQNLAEISWESLLDQISIEDLNALLCGMDLIGFVNWTMLPYMNSLFEGFRDLIRAANCRPHVFVDLADPAKRPSEDLLHALHLLSDLQAATDVIFGLNENESNYCADVLGLGPGDDLSERCRLIRDALGLSIVIIHPTTSAHAADSSGAYEVCGPHTSHPKLTTGAGDVFNAGFCHGLLSGCGAEQALHCGVCSSGYYVRNCRSPENEELIEFMRAWAGNQLKS